MERELFKPKILNMSLQNDTTFIKVNIFEESGLVSGG